MQPPGSRGDEGLPSHPRTETRDSGEESDGTSYTEDEDVDEHLDDPEDDEERLILNGGAGIPIIVSYWFSLVGIFRVDALRRMVSHDRCFLRYHCNTRAVSAWY